MKYVMGAAMLAAIQCGLILSVNEFYLHKASGGVGIQINGVEMRAGEIKLSPAKPVAVKHAARHVNRAPAVLLEPVDYALERRVDARLVERQQERRKLD